MNKVQMTVERLYYELQEVMRKGDGDKKIVIATDEEGNNYRGIYYSCTTDSFLVKENIESSNGLIDSEENNYDNLIIIG